MTSSRSLDLTDRTLTRLISPRAIPMMTAAALSVFVISGCGINIAPPQADSDTADTADADAAMSMASSGADGMGMTDPGMHAMESGADPATDQALAMAESMHDSTGDPANDPALAAVDGDPALDPAAAAGMTPEQMREMMEQQQAAGGVAGARDDGALTPEQRREMMQRQAGLAEAQDPAAAANADGADGAEGAGGGSSRASQFDEGTPAHTVMLMVEAIDDGDLETAAKYIGDDADGLLGTVRDGDAGQNQLLQLQSYFATMDPISARPSGRSITLTFNGGLNKVLSFVVAREGREFVVDSLTIREAQDRRGR